MHRGHIPSIFASLLRVTLAAGAAIAVHAQPPTLPLPRVFIPAPPSLALQPDAPLSPLRLLGFGVNTQDGDAPIDPITFAEDVKLEITLHWVPLGKVPAGTNVLLRFSGGGPDLEREYSVELTERQVGVVSRQRVTFPYEGLRYSGNATLTIATRDAGSRDYVQFVGPVRVLPRGFPSRIQEQALRKTFGEHVRPLIMSLCRLGPGATLRIPFTGPVGAIDRVAIVSATGYEGEPIQGARVCAVRALNEKGEAIATGYVEQGVTTAKSDYDYYPTGALKATRIAPFESTPAPEPNLSGEPYELHTYAATIPMKTDVPPAAIEIEYLLDDFVIDIKALALVPAQAPRK
ncbi:MAG: hypothetical protein HUU46_21950 [Candidatus Hydrogenedentes bacterium]|nr:hypothetical protein [Candidatus Hydrogenedentota bacterium]